MKNNLLIILLTIFCVFTINAQTFVSTQPENKNVILEEFTGISCVYCPDGHRIAQDLHNANPNDVFLINIHTGSYASPQGPGTDFRVDPIGSNIASQSGVSGYPSGTVNRHVFSGGITAMSRGDWTGAANQIMNVASPVNVGIQANVDMATNVLTVDVEVYYTGAQTVTSNMLNVAVVQNNVEGPQTGGSQYNPTAILANGNYNHQHMLRHMMTGQWGVPINTLTPGSLYADQFTWTMPADINGVALDPTNIAIVAFVAEGQQEIITGTEIYPNVIFANSFDAYCMSSSANDVICGSTTDIEVTFRNYGNVPLTSLDINYSINSGTTQTYAWSGNLPSAGTETITIPNVTFTPASNNTVNVSTSNPNGNTDQNTNNDNSSVTFNQFLAAGQVQSGVMAGTVTIDVTTDQYGNAENGWELKDESGNVVASAPIGSLTASSVQPTVTANLDPNKCYSFIFVDTYGDGICCTYGQGSYTVTDANGTVIAGGGSPMSFSNFYDKEDYFETNGTGPAASWDCDGQGNCFDPGTGNGAFSTLSSCQASCIVSSVNEKINGISIYPNPADNIISIDGKYITLDIYDVFGKLVYTTKNDKTINTTLLQNGVYFIDADTENGNVVKKIIISR
tara:strand:- start:1554 stop:3422 length:1869 start_codon:yes stop_codon:yes gene_type:complete